MSIDDDIRNVELKNIRFMIRNALHYGLLEEVIFSYTEYIRSGDSVDEAVAAAMYDWDI